MRIPIFERTAKQVRKLFESKFEDGDCAVILLRSKREDVFIGMVEGQKLFTLSELSAAALANKDFYEIITTVAQFLAEDTCGYSLHGKEYRAIIQEIKAEIDLASRAIIQEIKAKVDLGR